MNAKFINKIRNRNKACKPAKGIVFFESFGLRTRYNINEKTNEETNSNRNVSTGNPNTKTRKNSISPNPRASDSFSFILNFEYKNNTKINIKNTTAFIDICNKYNCTIVC